MSDKKNEKQEMIDKLEDFAKHDHKTLSRSSVSAHSIRQIHPLGMRVVVKLRPDADQTDSGLYLPEGAKEKTAESKLGEVLSVATAIDEDEDEEHNISGVPEGALVLIGHDAGVKVPWDDSLRIVDTKDVLAIVAEVDLL